MDAGPEKRGGDRRMQTVGRDDGHRLDPVGALRLGGGHRGEVVVGAVAGEAQLERRIDRALPLGRQRASHEHVVIVESRRHAVHGANEGPLPAPDHTEADPSIRRGVTAPVDHEAFPSSPSKRRFAP